MAETYGPFSTGAGSTVSDAQVPYYFGPFLADGVVQGVLNSLNTFGDSSGLQVKIDTGQAVLQGHFYRNDALLTKTLATADPSLARIDSVVVSMDLIGKTIAVTVLTGTPATTPVAPAVTQNANTWQILLATVNVAAAASTITAANVTDARTYAEGASVYADPTQTPSSNGPARPSKWFSWITHMIKAITGGTNWYSAPAATLASLSSGKMANDGTGVILGTLKLKPTANGANVEIIDLTTTDNEINSHWGWVLQTDGSMGLYNYTQSVWVLSLNPHHAGPVSPSGNTVWITPNDPGANAIEGDGWIDG